MRATEAGDVRLYGRMSHYLRPYVGLMVGGFIATLLFAAIDSLIFVMLIPFLRALFERGAIDYGQAGAQIGWLLRNTIGRFVGEAPGPGELLLRLNIFILGMFLLKNVVDFIQSVLVVRLEQSIVRDLRNEVYRHLVELDLRFFHRTRAGQIIARLTSDVDQLRILLTKNLFKLLTSVFQVIISIAIMVAISWQLTLVALVALPALFGMWSRFLRRLRRGDRTVLNLGGEVTSHLQETVNGIRQVKAAAGEPYEVQRFARLTKDYFKAFVRTERVRALAGPMSEMVGALGTVLLLWYGAHMVLVQGSIDAAAFLGFLAISLKMYAPAKWLSKFPSTVGPALVGAERIFEFLDTPIDMVDRPGVRDFAGVRDAVRFDDVTFGYSDDAPVLRNVSLEARRGAVVALVGPSGAGKTTLVDLVARFYDPTAGRITVDGVDLRDYNLKSLRRHLGVVTQETVLFHDTVRANIAYALPDAAQGAVEDAARAANAHEFIMQLPQGYDTVLGERGTRLSGGQRQRIAIARAILRDPPILIFDEATSALDSESERLVQEAIVHLLEGRTVFVIAHRLSTILNADQILVLDRGEVVQRGTHAELLAQGGLYRKLYRLQHDQRLPSLQGAAATEP
ncbi:MAG TPA: ABC transporter ATP-binding protein [Longimicrobiales bacterium]|nr:ABC transporter ATP-binding protein [Longimicrobiales bacterium]